MSQKKSEFLRRFQFVVVEIEDEKKQEACQILAHLVDIDSLAHHS